VTTTVCALEWSTWNRLRGRSGTPQGDRRKLRAV